MGSSHGQTLAVGSTIVLVSITAKGLGCQQHGLHCPDLNPNDNSDDKFMLGGIFDQMRGMTAWESSSNV